MKNQKNAVVIGGTDGVGKKIAYGLAEAGCFVLITGKNAEKANRVKMDIQNETGNRNIHCFVADLSLISEAKDLVEKIRSFFTDIHYLVQSAGIILNKRVITKEGVETNFAVNYLSRFIITTMLLPLLSRGGKTCNPAKILIINGAATGRKINFEDVNLKSNFGLIRFVGQQCYANDLFAIALDEKLRNDTAIHIRVNVLKLGVVKTNIRKTFPLWMKWMVRLVLDPLIGQTPEQAAATALELLLSKEYEYISGALYLKIRRLKRIFLPGRVLQKSLQIKMWEFSEQMIAKSGKMASELPMANT